MNKMTMETEDSPLSSIIARVESYIDNPKAVTTETLSALRDELVDLRSYMEGGEEPVESESMSGGNMSEMIGNMAKKGMMALFLMLAFAGFSSAASKYDEGVTYTSHTAAATAGTILFTSATVRFIGVTVSSSAENSRIAFFRSTRSILTPDIASQTVVNTGFNTQNTGNNFSPLWDMENSSFTLINKLGTAEVTYFFKCIEYDGNDSIPNKRGVSKGLCPGLPWSGRR